MYTQLAKLAADIQSQSDNAMAKNIGAAIGASGPVSSLAQYLSDYSNVSKKILNTSPDKYVPLKTFINKSQIGDVGLTGGAYTKAPGVQILQRGAEIFGGSPLAHGYAVGDHHRTFHGGSNLVPTIARFFSDDDIDTIGDYQAGGTAFSRLKGAFLDATDKKLRLKNENFSSAFKRHLKGYTEADKLRNLARTGWDAREVVRHTSGNPFRLEGSRPDKYGILLRAKGGLTPAQKAVAKNYLQSEASAAYGGAFWSAIKNIIAPKIPGTGGKVCGTPNNLHHCGTLPNKLVSLLGHGFRGNHRTALPFELLANPNLELTAIGTSDPKLTGDAVHSALRPKLIKNLRKGLASRLSVSALAILLLGGLGRRAGGVVGNQINTTDE